MLPIVSVPPLIETQMSNYRDVFCREAGFEHVSRYITGLIISPNKTLSGIYDLQRYDQSAPSRRAMHQAVFEAGWDSDEFIRTHRQSIAASHQGNGRQVISLDWTLSHHDKGPEIHGVKRGYDYVSNRMSRFQTVITATLANRSLIDGLDAVVQTPDWQKEEVAYLNATVQKSYEQMESAQRRLVELLSHATHTKAYKKRTEIVVEIVKQIEAENQFPQANYAFDNGVLSRPLTQFIESVGKHWVSEIECSRHIQWHGHWTRVDEIAAQLREAHPESFRPIGVTCRNGETKVFWAFTKVVRLKRYGRKRLVIVHETQELTDSPRFLLTDALHWESRRILQTWSYRWACEIFHEFVKQVTGFESSQVRKEEAVKRHFRLSCVAQSMVQRAPVCVTTSEKFMFAKGKSTFGQKCRAISREVFRSLLHRIKTLFAQGKDCHQIMELLMPA